jgi:hypothetical protein
MNTRSQNSAQKFSIAEVEAAKALLQLKKAIGFTKTGYVLRDSKWPSGRPRRSTAGHVDYREQD